MDFWFFIAEYAVSFAIIGCILLFFITFLTDHFTKPKPNEESNGILFRQFKFAILIFGVIGVILGSYNFEHRSDQEKLQVDLYTAGYEDAIENVDWCIRENYDELYIIDGESLIPVEINAFEANEMLDISRAIDWMQ